MSEEVTKEQAKKMTSFNAGYSYAMSLVKARLLNELIELDSMPDRIDEDYNEGYRRALKHVEWAVKNAGC